MPKRFIAHIDVPSGSRLDKWQEWLNKLLAEHGMTCKAVEEDPDAS